MDPTYRDETVTLHHGEALATLRTMPDSSVDSVVTDPPAGIGFMSRAWDRHTTDLPQPDFLNWFAGFVDGEGCFSIHKKNVNGYETYDCQFAISLRADDRPVLVEIQRTLGIGTISKPSAHRNETDNPKARFSISSKSDCLRLTEILRAAPLRAKKALDFEEWVIGLREWVDHQPGEWATMLCARERLMAGRAFTEIGKVAGPPERRAFIAFLTPILRECLRVAKPGSYALVWAIPRTSHWTGTAIEDAGWVIQDRISHLFGQGFPKHKSKLKPACEDWWLAWKPDRYATPLPGLDGCRIETNNNLNGGAYSEYGNRSVSQSLNASGINVPGKTVGKVFEQPFGRWPANVTLDCEAASLLDQQSGQLTSGKPMGIKTGGKLNCYSEFAGGIPVTGFGDSGGASRFFYVAKASRSERNAGCEDMEKQMLRWSSGDQSPGTFQSEGTDGAAHNHHPTVKPVDLMRWLCRLITPPGGIVLDAFMGSGTTGLAATEEKFRFIGIEREAAYYEIAKRRICAPAGPLFE